MEKKWKIYNNKNLGELPVYQILQQLSLKDLLWDFDVVNLYSSAMSDEKSIFPRIETGCALTKDMNDELVEELNTKVLTQGIAILKIKVTILKV